MYELGKKWQCTSSASVSTAARFLPSCWRLHVFRDLRIIAGIMGATSIQSLLSAIFKRVLAVK
jgi:hypothetical protein